MSGRETPEAAPGSLVPFDVVPLVEATIAFAIQRLLADHPELLALPDAHRRPAPGLEAARVLVARCDDLLDAFRWYRAARAVSPGES